MEEENKIQEAETLKPEKLGESEEIKAKKRKMDFYIEVILFFILGILIGIAVKTEAAKRIVVGFDDYKMKIIGQDYDINKIEKDLIEKMARESQKAEEGLEDTVPEAPQNVQPAN